MKYENKQKSVSWRSQSGFCIRNVSTETHYLCRNFMRDSFNYILSSKAFPSAPRCLGTNNFSCYRFNNISSRRASCQPHFWLQNKTKTRESSSWRHRIESKQKNCDASAVGWVEICQALPMVYSFCCFHLARREKEMCAVAVAVQF